MCHSLYLCLANWFTRFTLTQRERVWVFSWGCGFCLLTRIHTFPQFVVTGALFRHRLSITVIRSALSGVFLSAVLVNWMWLIIIYRTMQNFGSGRFCSLTLFSDSLPLVVSRTTFLQSLWRSRVQCVDRRPSCQRKEFVLYRTTSSSLISWRFDS